MVPFKSKKRSRFIRLVKTKLAANLIKDLKDRWAQIMLVILLILLGVQVIPKIEISFAIWIAISVFILYLVGRLLACKGMHLELGSQRTVLLASVPLDEYGWEPLPECTAVALQHGEVRAHASSA